jgi:hypothetical protein
LVDAADEPVLLLFFFRFDDALWQAVLVGSVEVGCGVRKSPGRRRGGLHQQSLQVKAGACDDGLLKTRRVDFGELDHGVLVLFSLCAVGYKWPVTAGLEKTTI